MLGPFEQAGLLLIVGLFLVWFVTPTNGDDDK